MLQSVGLKAPTATKTGTTIAGVVFKVCQSLVSDLAGGALTRSRPVAGAGRGGTGC